MLSKDRVEPEHEELFPIEDTAMLAVCPSTICKASSTPEERIWAGVLVTAISDLGRKAHREEALAWIQERGSGIGSFDFCCELFGLAPDRVSRFLLDEYQPRYLQKG
jgi:hypothetical protein